MDAWHIECIPADDTEAIAAARARGACVFGKPLTPADLVRMIGDPDAPAG